MLPRPLLSVDPGVRACGCALWDTDGRLLDGWLVKNPCDERSPSDGQLWKDMALAVWASVHPIPHDLAIEYPQVYARSKSKGDPNDLIAVAGVVGAICVKTKGSIATYLPHAWKGDRPKAVMHNLIREVWLDDSEIPRVKSYAKTLAHNVWDAVGIGAYHLRAIRVSLAH